MAKQASDVPAPLMGVGEMVDRGLLSPSALNAGSTRWRRISIGLLAVIDAVVVCLAFMTAYWVRYDIRIGPAIRDQLGFSAWTPLMAPLLGLTLFYLWARGAYRFRMGDEIQDDATAAFAASTLAVATLVVVTSMLHQYEYSRAVIVYLWIALILFVTVGRWIFRALMGELHTHGLGVRRLLIVGATDVGKMIMQSVASRRDLGYELVGFVHARTTQPTSATALPADFGRFRNLGFAGDVPFLIARERVDEVIIALPAADHEDIWPILQQCDQDGVGLKIVPDMFELSLGRVQVDDIGGIPIFDVREQPFKRVKLRAKQSFEWVLTLAISIVFLPLMGIVALLVRLDSPGPVIYVQDRIGLNGRRFRCYKFRSMEDGADGKVAEIVPLNETGGPTFKAKNDPRYTRVGRIIRRHSLDELPQLWNVLKGDMSLVGPRPALPTEVDCYDRWQYRRLQVPPGITGMWQVSGRSDLKFDEMITMDIYYIENWSFALDVKILVRTIAAMLTGRGAY